MSDRVKITADETLLGTEAERPRVDVLSRRRVVRMLPVPLPGSREPIMRPAIWTNPVAVEDPAGRKVRQHIVLLRRGPPVDVAVISVLDHEAINCPEDVVECEEMATISSIPRDQPLRGSTRYVPLFPVPGATVMCPCIWMSPYEIADDDLKQRVRVCVLLLSSGPPKPEVVAIRVPSSVIHKFPTGPIDW